jgi:hypothetical protein
MSTRPAIARLQSVERAARARPGLWLVSLIVACVGLGAAVAAGIHPASSLVRAEAELTVTAPTAALQPTAWHTVGQVLKVHTVRAQIARLSGQEASKLRIGTSGDPRSSLVAIHADSSSGPAAQLVANSAASVAVNFLRQAVEGAGVTRSTFDQTSEAWDLGAGIFVLPANRIAPTRSISRRGGGSLEVNCVTVVRGGCGSYLRLERDFRKGRAYLAAGWVKARPHTRIRLVLGAGARDVAVGATTAGGRHWKRLSVTWTPKRNSGLAVSAFQVMSLGASHFNIDDVEVGPQAEIQRGAPALASVTRYETIVPASRSSALGRGHTAEWAAGGAGVGLLVGAAAAAAATAAARHGRRRRADDQESLF